MFPEWAQDSENAYVGSVAWNILCPFSTEVFAIFAVLKDLLKLKHSYIDKRLMFVLWLCFIPYLI